MMLFSLGKTPFFPAAELAPKDYPACVGGDLSVERLLSAYRSGFFPWFNPSDPPLWWSPDPRPVIRPESPHISKSMRRVLNSGQFSFSLDTCFSEVMQGCAEPREYSDATWISSEFLESYKKLHQMGYAHSVEVWDNEKNLVGGLYGVSMGKWFFGESMFHRVSNASKYGFLRLCELLARRDFIGIDCQYPNNYLKSLGYVLLPRAQFLKELRENHEKPDLLGSWSHWIDS